MPYGTYVFCFAEPNVKVDLDRVRTQRSAACSAVISEVEVEEFSQENMENADWLLPRATWHEQVVETVLALSPVLPAPFGTLFSTPEKLSQYIELNQERIARFLREIAGKQEWSLKVAADLQLVSEPPVMAAAQGQQQADLSGLTPGARYLEEKKKRSQPEGSALEPIISAVAEDLGTIASARVARKVVNEEDAERPVLQHWAFLVPGNQVDVFRALAEAAAREYGPHGLEFRVSGPWPPYSFVPELQPLQD